MKKFVSYHGQSLDNTSNCSKLDVGQIYRVIAIDSRDWQPQYRLKGIDGWYNADLFDDVYTSLKTPIEEIFSIGAQGVKRVLVWLGICSPSILKCDFQTRISDSFNDF